MLAHQMLTHPEQAQALRAAQVPDASASDAGASLAKRGTTC